MGTARGVREATSDLRNDAAAADRVPHAHCRRRGAGCPVASSPNLSPPRALPAAKRNDPDFFIGNRVRTCISDDVNEAKAMLRKTMANYWAMPNYRNYWKEAGYLDEINAAEAAIAAGRTDELPRYLTIAGWRIALCMARRSGSAKGSGNGAMPASPPLSWCRSRPTAIRWDWRRCREKVPMTGGLLKIDVGGFLACS